MKIIDSSTIVKYFSAEPGWGKIRPFLSLPVTIELSIKELGSALWKKVNKKEFEMDSALEILLEFQRIAKFYGQKKDIKRAFEIAVSHHITIYDSLFIAAALAENFELVTSDARQGKIASESGVIMTII